MMSRTTWIAGIVLLIVTFVVMGLMIWFVATYMNV